MMSLSKAAATCGLKVDQLHYAIRTEKLVARKIGAGYGVTTGALNAYMNEYRTPKPRVAAATLKGSDMTESTPKAPLPAPTAKKTKSIFGARKDIHAMAQISRILAPFTPRAAERILETVRDGLDEAHTAKVSADIFNDGAE